VSGGHDIGELFDGRYRLERRIGSGGMADVYLASDESLHRRVAIKILADRYTRDEGFIERFRREATAAAGLTQPNIVAIYDRGEAGGEYYIAMEYVDGPTLKDEINAHAPLPEQEAITYAQQALSALEFAHRAGVIHRDVKPHNMLITPDGVLKMTDFGIARAAHMTDMTEAGSIVGTAQYLSPEQARGQQVGPQSDIYSLGVVLYEMLTGDLPFSGSSAVEIAMKQVSDPPPPPSLKNRLITPALEQVIMRALAKDPALRFRSAREMADELERVRRGLTVSSATQQATAVMAAPTAVMAAAQVAQGETPPPPQGKRSMMPWLIVAALLLASLAVGWVIYNQYSGDNGVSVPDVVGLTQSQARQQLVTAGFTVQQKPASSDLANKGRVVKTDPEAHSSAPEGSTVIIYVGNGQKPVTLPDLTGANINDAIAQVNALGLTPHQNAVTSPQPSGTVVRQKPGPGQVPAGSTVQLYYSSGNVKVPALAGLSCSEAQSKLQGVGLSGTCQDTPSDTVPSGQVIASVPAAGQPAPQGSTVTVQVSSGPSEQPVPDVVGEAKNDATKTLQQSGFKASIVKCVSSGGEPDGTVVKQDPPANQNAAPGTTVTLYVAKATETTVCPA
jgi:eukaryotic-like serine/threonine-protein kinase